MQPYPQERGITEDYMLAAISISIVCVLWIVFNEAVIKIANITASFPLESQASSIVSLLVTIWRALPVAIIIGVLVWVLMRAVKREPYAQYTGWT